MHFTAAIALAFTMALGGNSAQTTSNVFQIMPQAQTVEEYVRTYFADIPIMAEISKCESRFRQYDKSGSVLRGEMVHEDVGVMQINETYHKDTADTLGFDLSTMQGNVAYARYLYEKEGTTPWNSSSVCWNKSKVAKELALNSK